MSEQELDENLESTLMHFVELSLAGDPERELVVAKELVSDLFATHYKAREDDIREDELIRLDYAIENRPNLSTSPNGGDVQRYCDARRRLLKGKQEYDPRMHLGYPAIKLSKDSNHD